MFRRRCAKCSRINCSKRATRRHLENLLELAEKRSRPHAKRSAGIFRCGEMYFKSLSAALHLWNDKYNRNLINAFRELQDEGVLEIITCGATHGFLPLISTAEAKRAQIEIAVKNYQKHFHRKPRGIWLPECAYEPGSKIF
jgi:1,4-alpha-glucan branching enzyme